jgi:hypothetical protein
MNNKKHLYLVATLLLGASLCVMSSCSQPSSPSNTISTTVKTPVQDNSDHKGKNKNSTQSVNVTISNTTSESFDATVYMGLSYEVVPILSGPGLFYDDIASTATSLVVNSQTVPYNTETTVTLLNNHTVKVTWNNGETGISVSVVLSGG